MTAPRAVPFWSADEVERAIPGALAHLRANRVLAYPTETVYGFGGAVSSEAVNRLIQLKGRPPNKPFLLIISGSDMLARLDLHLPAYAAHLAAHFWPGPLTLVLPGGEKRVPDKLRGPEGGIAVRWSPHRGLARLVEAHGEPITSTSANRPGSPTAESAAEIVEQWNDALGRGTLHVLDGGRLTPSQPSTVVDCTGAGPKVIRTGAIPLQTLRRVVPDLTDS